MAASRELKSLLKICIANATEKVPWSPYCDKLMRPLLSFDKMQSRRDVETESGGLLRYPARNAFATVTEASVALAYGIMLEFRQAPLHNMRHAWPGSEHNEVYLQQIMRALGIVFDQSVSDDKMITDRKTWQDLLLNQRPDALSVFSSTRVIDDQGLVLSSMQALLRCYNWTEEQNAALKGCTWLTARVGIVEGHTGSGKTQLLAGMAAFYASVCLHVLVCTPSSATAKAFSGLLRDMNMRLEKERVDNLVYADILEVYAFERVYDNMKDGEQLPTDWITDANILITTPNFVCCKKLLDHFGSSSKGIVVLHDDSQHNTEAEILSTFFSLRHSNFVQGLIMAVDSREWPMDVMTETDPILELKRKKDHKRKGYYKAEAAMATSSATSESGSDTYMTAVSHFYFLGFYHMIRERDFGNWVDVNRLARDEEQS